LHISKNADGIECECTYAAIRLIPIFIYNKTKRQVATVPTKEKFKFFWQLSATTKVAGKLTFSLIPIVPEECILNGIVEVASLDHVTFSIPVLEAPRSKCRGIADLGFGGRS
jgi:hypothetical protein